MLYRKIFALKCRLLAIKRAAKSHGFQGVMFEEMCKNTHICPDTLYIRLLTCLSNKSSRYLCAASFSSVCSFHTKNSFHSAETESVCSFSCTQNCLSPQSWTAFFGSLSRCVWLFYIYFRNSLRKAARRLTRSIHEFLYILLRRGEKFQFFITFSNEFVRYISWRKS